jgi:hypothetical protein
MHLCSFVNEEGGDGEGTFSEDPSLLSYTLRHVSLSELGTLCQFGLQVPMDLCACLSEEGGDGEGTGEGGDTSNVL